MAQGFRFIGFRLYVLGSGFRVYWVQSLGFTGFRGFWGFYCVLVQGS